MRLWKYRAEDKWLGLFYIGWVGHPDDKCGLSVCFGKKCLALMWRH